MAATPITMRTATAIPRPTDVPLPSDWPPDSAVHKWEWHQNGTHYSSRQQKTLWLATDKKCFSFWRNLISKNFVNGCSHGSQVNKKTYLPSSLDRMAARKMERVSILLWGINIWQNILKHWKYIYLIIQWKSRSKKSRNDQELNSFDRAHSQKTVRVFFYLLFLLYVIYVIHFIDFFLLGGGL